MAWINDEGPKIPEAVARGQQQPGLIETSTVDKNRHCDHDKNPSSGKSGTKKAARCGAASGQAEG
jgi:hypothetical protein